MLKSTSKAPQLPSTPAKTTSVTVDSSVVLRIVKHGYENYPAAASGHLLGYEHEDQQSVLDVTHAFAFPNSVNENDGAGIRSNSALKYQNDMIELLRDVNVDAHTVGYYVSLNMGRFFSQTDIDNLLSYQASNPEAVVLVYDPAKSSHTGLSLKAYRLSPSYLAVRKEGKFVTDNLVKHDLSYHTIFQELSVTITNSHLVTMYLHSLKQKEKNFDHLSISIDTYMEKNIEGIFDAVDDFHYDQGNYNFYQRQMTREKQKIQQWQQKRKAENNTRQQRGDAPLSTEDWKSLFKLPEEPSRAENLLISAQIDRYCNQIEEFGATVNPKLFAVQKSLE